MLFLYTDCWVCVHLVLVDDVNVITLLIHPLLWNSTQMRILYSHPNCGQISGDWPRKQCNIFLKRRSWKKWNLEDSSSKLVWVLVHWRSLLLWSLLSSVCPTLNQVFHFFIPCTIWLILAMLLTSFYVCLLQVVTPVAPLSQQVCLLSYLVHNFFHYEVVS